MDPVKLIETLGLSPVCALILVACAVLLWDRKRLAGRVTDLTDRHLDDLTRRAALWERSKKEAEG